MLYTLTWTYAAIRKGVLLRCAFMDAAHPTTLRVLIRRHILYTNDAYNIMRNILRKGIRVPTKSQILCIA